MLSAFRRAWGVIEPVRRPSREPPQTARRRALLLLLAHFLLEVALIAVFLKLYNITRNQFGSQKCTPKHALDNALQVIRAEQLLGMFWEQEVQVSTMPLWLLLQVPEQKSSGLEKSRRVDHLLPRSTQR